MSRIVTQRCEYDWDYLGKDKHAAHVISFALELCTWTSCNTLSSSHSLWPWLSFFSCLVSGLRYLYEKGLLCYRNFMSCFTVQVRTNFSCLLCLDLHDTTLPKIYQQNQILENNTPNLFFYFIPERARPSLLVHPRVYSSTLFIIVPEYLRATNRPSHRTHQSIRLPVLSLLHATLIPGQTAGSMLRKLERIGIVGRDFFVSPVTAPNLVYSGGGTIFGATFNPGDSSPSNSGRAVIPKSLCSSPSGLRNRNFKGVIKSAASATALCLCLTPANAAHIAKDTQIPGIVYLIPQPDPNSHLARRDTSTHDPRDGRWRGMVIGSTIGSTAGAVILGIGIYLLFRARRKRHISQSEPQPIEMEPARSSRAMSPNIAQVPRARPPPRAQVQDTSAPPSSRVAKTPRTPSLASLELQPRLLHPHDINRATHIRASTGSQFTEHFDPVFRAHRRLSEGMPSESSQSPSAAAHHPREGADPQSSGQHRNPNVPSISIYEEPLERSERPGSSLQMTAVLPPGAAAPVESVGNYMPPEATGSQNGRIQLS
ncbi:hypothetical protein RSOLAG1IB_04751 [Rhizoctonia solani AG-1 IB]|uniref:Uncharacterized protein n=1 Tax=Thanatephorus cucumeris (strain AG1-IB / isolate 7/3/14) TaxID=1108050 RepID=A0A0B7FWD0_THACB|nr:hypothetical protein RSOLAG1IB_04751 [Rhizoctonia solani AG-1 IB]